MAMDRKEIMQDLRGLFRFFVYCMDKHGDLMRLNNLQGKEDGVYKCRVLIYHDNMFITLRGKKSNQLVHTFSIKYDYIHTLGSYGWYINSLPYKRGNPDRFLEVSLFLEELNEQAFALMLGVVSKDAQLRSLHRLLKEWQNEINKIYSEVAWDAVDGCVPMELRPTGYLRDARIN